MADLRCGGPSLWRTGINLSDSSSNLVYSVFKVGGTVGPTIKVVLELSERIYLIRSDEANLQNSNTSRHQRKSDKLSHEDRNPAKVSRRVLATLRQPAEAAATRSAGRYQQWTSAAWVVVQRPGTAPADGAERPAN